MSYTPATDFVGVWRAIAGGVEKGEVPGLDLVVAALGRAGLLNVTVSGIAPVANQATTAWFQPASPSYSAEGALYLWNSVASAYQAATPALFRAFLEASFGSNGVSWFSSVGGPPANTVGNNGDFAVRTDSPGGIYGPKTAGAWPASPLPGTSYSELSTELDYAFGTPGQGTIIFRGAAGWQVLPPGASGSTLTTHGAGADPSWTALSNTVNSAAFDAAFGSAVGSMLYRAVANWQTLAVGAAGTIMTSTGSAPSWSTVSAILDSLGSAQGSILYRNNTGWTVLGPGTNGYVLTTNGGAANPSWNSPASATVNSAALDTAFGSNIGGVLIRGVSGWQNLGVGTSGYILTAQGAGAAPAWAAVTASVPAPTSVGGIAILKDAQSRAFTIGTVFTAGAGVTYNDNALGSPTPVGTATTWQYLGAPQPQDGSGYTYHLVKRIS